MRSLSAFFLSFCLATVCACGGGGGGIAAGQGALVSGKVTGVDGSSADVAGIVIESRGDGTTAVTGSDGSFQFQVRPGDRVLLKFQDPDHPEDGAPTRDPEEKDDLTPDGADINGDEVELEPLGADESCEIEVEIKDGEVVECRVEHPDREAEGEPGPRFEAECRLKPTEGSSEPEAVAEAELECEGDCCALEVEVAGVVFAATLTVAVECEEAIEELGVIEVVEGGGHFEIDSCELDVLPLGVESIYDLRGCTLLLLDESGNVALAGCVPGEREEEKRDRFVEDCGLEPTDLSSEPDAKGGSVLRCQAGSCKLVVEVGGVLVSKTMTAVVECKDLREELGVIEIVEGQGRFAKEYGPDDTRPFGVESLQALGECRLLLLDGQGEAALAGCFPGKRERDEAEEKEFVEDCRLEPVDGSSQPTAEGVSVVRCGARGCSLVVELGGVVGAQTLKLVVACEGDEVELGVIEIVEGQGRFAKEYGPDDTRPFGVESLQALGGCELLVVDGEGAVALKGCFPGKVGGDGEGGKGDGEER